MENKKLHPAEAFLRNPENSSSLYVRIEGRRRRLFINRNTGLIGIIALGRRKKGYIFSEWNTIEKFTSQQTGRKPIITQDLFSGIRNLLPLQVIPTAGLGALLKLILPSLFMRMGLLPVQPLTANVSGCQLLKSIVVLCQ